MFINTPAALAAYLRDCRRRQGQTQNQTAQSVGIRQATVSAFESHPERGKVETLFKLAAALDLELHLIPRSCKVDHGEESW
ncbi:MAG: helix-turn-helix domain-containing protein [Neisseria sp.]|nr:helix-turn-helix domain-containing protein [Neisseria sp.]